MRSGKGRAAVIFSKKQFWPPVMWIAALASGVALGCAFRLQELISAVVLAAFLGLNETGRWAYRTNLLICTAASVFGSVAGVFSWFQTAFIFALLFVVCGYMLYFRDSARRLLPYLEEFSSEIASGKNLGGTVEAAVDMLSAMSGGEAVFVAVTDGKGGLYLPEYHGDGRMNLKRNGGAIWKVFAASRSYMTNHVEPSRDLPLDMDARSIMSAPLLARGEKLGVLQMESDLPSAFTDYDLSKLEMLAFILSQALFDYIFEPASGDNKAASEKVGAETAGYKFRKRAEDKKTAAPPRGPLENAAQSKLDLEFPEQ